MFGKSNTLTVSKILTEDSVEKLVESIRNRKDKLSGAIVILATGNEKFYDVFVINMQLGETIGALDLAKHDIEHNGVPRL